MRILRWLRSEPSTACLSVGRFLDRQQDGTVSREYPAAVAGCLAGTTSRLDSLPEAPVESKFASENGWRRFFEN
jgi:hypothetical protein